VSWVCNSRCGEGLSVLLTKREGTWKVETDFIRWVS